MNKIFLKKIIFTSFTFLHLTSCNQYTNTSTSNPIEDISTNISNIESNYIVSSSEVIDKSSLPSPDEVDYDTIKNLIINQSDSIDISNYKNNISYDENNIVNLKDGETISESGDFLLSGIYTSGLTINASKDSIIHLYLNNATINGNETSGIIKSDKKITLIITLLDNTNNTITSSGDSNNVIQVKGDLIINGTGTLNVNTESLDATGIKVSSSIYILNANINVSSSKHGVAAEVFYMGNATLNITNLDASKDGIHVECDYDNKKGTTYDFDYSLGYVIIKDSSYICNVSGDGIQADSFVNIDNSNININSKGTFVAYSTSNMETYDLNSDDFKYQYTGGTYKRVASDEIRNIASYYALKESCKGIKVGTIEYDTDGDDVDDIEITSVNYGLVLNESSININTTDDAIHTNYGNSYMLNSNITINTSDDGISSDNVNYIDGGKINIESSYEGLEESYIKILDGTIDINSLDDGINATSDDSSIIPYILIEGGTINIYNDGDGIDSNGYTYINGGNIIVHGPNNSGDSPLDATKGTYINYGNVICYTTSTMYENPTSNSSQYVISTSLGNNYAANSLIEIKDASSVVLASITITTKASRILASLQAFKLNETYSIYVNNKKVKDVTIKSKVTSDGGNSRPGMHGER